MKKLLITTVLFLSIAVTSFAGDAINVNSKAVRKFSFEFAEAKNVRWTSTENYTKASFTLNNVAMEAFYDFQGNFMGKTNKIDIAVLPISAKRLLAKRYADCRVKEAIVFESTDETAYYISVENETHSLILKVIEGGLVSLFKKTNR